MAAHRAKNALLDSKPPMDTGHQEYVERLRLIGRTNLQKIGRLEGGRAGDKMLEWLASELNKMDGENGDHLFEINSALAYARGYLNGKRTPERNFHCYCYQIHGPNHPHCNRTARGGPAATVQSAGPAEAREAQQENVVAGNSAAAVDEPDAGRVLPATKPIAGGLDTAHEATVDQQPPVAWESCQVEEEDEPDFTRAVEPDHPSREDGGPDVFSTCFLSLVRPRREDGHPFEVEPFCGPPGVMGPVSEETVAHEESPVLVGTVADTYCPLGSSLANCSII